MHVRCIINAQIFFFQAEDGIRDLVRSRGLGDVYKRQRGSRAGPRGGLPRRAEGRGTQRLSRAVGNLGARGCLLYTSDAADERSSVDLGGRRIIKKKHRERHSETRLNIDK